MYVYRCQWRDTGEEPERHVDHDTEAAAEAHQADLKARGLPVSVVYRIRIHEENAA